jgi:hypothetical protein
MPSRRLASQAPQQYLELTEWDRGVPTDDGCAIWLLTILGVFQPARIDVDETAEHVIISLYVRSLTPQPGEIISVPAIGRIASLAVPLSPPLAARRLLDGATGEPPPRRGVAIPEPRRRSSFQSARSLTTTLSRHDRGVTDPQLSHRRSEPDTARDAHLTAASRHRWQSAAPRVDFCVQAQGVAHPTTAMTLACRVA